MKILPLHPKLENYLTERNLKNKFAKQKKLFEQNPFHPGLNTELLEPKSMRIWSFRVSGKYRAIFIFEATSTVQIVDINNHYQ
jgi:plasmid maintenance system killer protein